MKGTETRRVKWRFHVGRSIAAWREGGAEFGDFLIEKVKERGCKNRVRQSIR